MGLSYSSPKTFFTQKRKKNKITLGDKRSNILAQYTAQPKDSDGQIFIIERKKRSIFILHCTSLWIFLRGTQPYNHHGSKILPPKGFINAFLYGFETSSLQEPSPTTSLNLIFVRQINNSCILLNRENHTYLTIKKN